MEINDDNGCNGTQKTKKKPLDLGWNRLLPNTSSGDDDNRSPELIIQLIIPTSSKKSDGGGGDVHAPPQENQKDDLELMTKTDDELHLCIARKKECFRLVGKMLPDKGEILMATIRQHEIELERRHKLKLEKETCEAKVCKPVPKRKKGRSPILQAKRPNGLQKGNSCSRPPDQHDKSVAQNNAIMNSEYQQVWPFMKQSAIWATIESLESYRQQPQKPHFSPLKKVKADYREGLAISHMVTFDNLFQNISKIQLTDPVDIIKDSLETLVNLETHGFDVGAVRARLYELLSWKDKVGQLRDMAKKDEEELEKCKEEMNQLEVRIRKLQTKMEQNAKQIIDCELAFKNHAATPL